MSLVPPLLCALLALLAPAARAELIDPRVREYAELEDPHAAAARSYRDEMGPWTTQGWNHRDRPYVVRERRRLELEPVWEHYQNIWAEDRRKMGFPEPPENMTPERYLREDWLEKEGL